MKRAADYQLGMLPQAMTAGGDIIEDARENPRGLAELVDQGVDVDLEVFVMTFDVAIPGVEMAYRHGNCPIRGRTYERLSAVMTFSLQRAAEGATDEQVWSEGRGLDMSLAMLLSDEDVHDCVVICKNDCAPSLAAMEKGSSRSAQLQEAADSACGVWEVASRGGDPRRGVAHNHRLFCWPPKQKKLFSAPPLEAKRPRVRGPAGEAKKSFSSAS